MADEIDDTVGVAELVIVPWDQLDEVVVELDTGQGVEDGWEVGAVEVWNEA